MPARESLLTLPFLVGPSTHEAVCTSARRRTLAGCATLCDDPRVPLGEQRTGMAAKVRVWVDGSSRLVLPSIPSEARRGVGPL